MKINYLAFGMFVCSKISALITGHPPETFIADNSQELCQNSKKGFQQIMDQTILLITGSEQNADIFSSSICFDYGLRIYEWIGNQDIEKLFFCLQIKQVTSLEQGRKMLFGGMPERRATIHNNFQHNPK